MNDVTATPSSDPAWLPLDCDGMMVSYAGFGEDVMLRRFFGDQASGFWIDVEGHEVEILQGADLPDWRPHASS